MKLTARPASMAVLACTLGLQLSGCAELATMIPDRLARAGTTLTQPGDGADPTGTLTGPTAGNPAEAVAAITNQVGRTLIQDALTALQANVDMDLAGMLAGDTSLPVGYRILAADASTTDPAARAGASQGGQRTAPARLAELAKQRMREHMQKLHERAQKHLEARRGATRVAERTVVENEDGTRTITARMEITTRAGTQKQFVERTLDADGILLDSVHDFERQGKNGKAMKSHRERHTADDGSWTGTFKLEITRKDGKTKTVEWQRSGSADGSEVGEGKITRFDGTEVTIKVSKTSEGEVTTETTDSDAGIAVEIAGDDQGTAVEATVRDAETDEVLETVDLDPAAVEAIEPSDA